MTYERLRELFSYNQTTGQFTNLTTRNNKALSGSIVHGARSPRGQLNMSVDGTKVMYHRAVWMYHYNTIPKLLVHVDGDKTNNCLDNLLEVSHYSQAPLVLVAAIA